jgi:purine nucleosidase
MGGYIRGATYGGGVLSPSIDCNLCADPDASRGVLGAGIPTRLIPTDVTTQVWIEERDVRALERSSAALHHALGRAVRRWMPIQSAFLEGVGVPGSDNAAFLHDPLALACAYDESFCSFADLPIEPSSEDGIFRTRERRTPGPSVPLLRCATEVDRERFRAHFRERLGLPR